MFDYVCVYDFNRVPLAQGTNHIARFEHDGVFAFKDGFWITEDLAFTKGHDAKYWIPPSRILYVEKVEIARSRP
jgi:hypothetical protein